ncbi:hypothetical protein [Methylobacterium sp. WL64]|nr:hypothetical protein [Methylobacterium sp. WL64]
MVFVYDLGDVVAVILLAFALVSFGYLQAVGFLRKLRAARKEARS